MQKKLIVPISILVISGLAGCSQDQNAKYNQTKNQFQPVGYYTNDVNVVDHDGPMTELMDYSFGRVDNIKNNNYFLPSGQKSDYDRHINSPLDEYNSNNFGVNRNRHLRDINYHGHLNKRNARGKSSYYTAYEGRLAERISQKAASVANVSNARTIIDGDKILVSLVLKKDKNVKKTKLAVEQAVYPYIRDRKYFITSDIGTYYRVRDLDNDLKDGGPRDKIKLDVHDLMQSQNIKRNQQ
ncbi:YhcN/YlaJ family sporulation lipoprotein [Heyndrickxia sp. NPDC080065]|uniref:YhcN/YlaJ family sporulation lipoprotein n=1 Tax=Heyndrickxia sp. NPDC080065 TaxID=3390568 RepID=UPI003D09421B